MKLILENVRCFAGRHEHEIRPLTLLVGENSAGKTTLLGTLSAVCSSLGNPVQPRFNDRPYNLGTYDTIATNLGGESGPAETFAIGIGKGNSANDRSSLVEILMSYRSRRGDIELNGLKLKNSHGELSLERRIGGYSGRYRRFPDQTENIFEFTVRRQETSNIRFLILTSLIQAQERAQKQREQAGESPWDQPEGILFRLDSLLDNLRPIPMLSIGPVRSEPRRTYERITENLVPEGSDMPLILAQNLGTANARRGFLSALKRFGKESGLYSSIAVRALGDNRSDPFQVFVGLSGYPRNITDVGYGVSQSLPLVVHSVVASREVTLLMQQPEVHLHPRAQAALGSFFVDLVAAGSRQFVIETHSDYIIDRIRLEVARGRLNPELVSILYFERKGAETTIHEIEVDQLGNVANAPPTYRSFFLQEELNLLTRAGK